MYSAFFIDNFRGIRRLALSEFSRINLVSGPNDVGKTAFLEALFLHACGPLAPQLAVQVVRPSRGQSALEVGPTGESPWRSFFSDFDEGKPISLNGVFDGLRYGITLSQPSNDAPLGIQRGGDPAQQVWSNELHLEEHRDGRPPQTYRSTITVQTGAAPGGAGQQALVQANIEPFASRPFTPALLVSTNRANTVDLGAGYSRLRQQGRAKDLVDALRLVDPRIKALELLVSDGTPALHAVLKDERLLPFALMGDGLSSVAALIIGMTDLRGGVLLIDEIENGLHHSVLKEVWHHIFSVARRLDVQVFAATHSHECVVAAHSALSGQRDALSLLQFARGREDDSPMVASYDMPTLGAGIELDASLR